jgi:hypothetical protein
LKTEALLMTQVQSGIIPTSNPRHKGVSYIDPWRNLAMVPATACRSLTPWYIHVVGFDIIHIAA